MQFDADTVGAASPAADAEMCMMAADALEAVGIPRGQYVIKVNSRKVLDGVMEAAGVADERQKLTVLRAIDKLDRLGIDGVRRLLGPGRKDDSGDFTKGAELDEQQAATILAVLAPADSARPDGGDVLARSSIGEAGRQELATIDALLRAAGYADRVRIDPSVVRGLEYYTGPVFEAELTLAIPNEKGEPVVFGSVGGGGRYDGLVGRFLGTDVPATGFSVGVSRLQAALTALGTLGAADIPGPVVVLVLDRDRVPDYQAMVAELRRAGIAAEMYLGEAGMKAQMKYADRRNSPLAVIQGGDEKARRTVQIKDLVAGKTLAAGIADHQAYEKERPGQVEAPEAELVETVRRLLVGSAAGGG
jgi:histidyl-tRNA synthetase